MCFLLPASSCVFVHASLLAERQRWPDGGLNNGLQWACSAMGSHLFLPHEIGRCELLAEGTEQAVQRRCSIVRLMGGGGRRRWWRRLGLPVLFANR